MKVSGFWSAAGAVILGLIIADIIAPAHLPGTKAAFSGITTLEKNTGNQLIGTAA